MIDAERLAELRTAIRGGESPKDPLAEMSQSELRRLRGEIDRLLPDKQTLGEMDMPSELMSQFQVVKDLQDSVINDSEVPANQRAQVAGAVASTLQQLVKMQSDFYTAERFRSIENLMIQYMKKLPLDEANRFLDEYEKLGDGE